VLLCVPDGAIQSAIRRFPASWQSNPDVVWLHTSGALPGRVLRPFAAGHIGSMHPLAPFPPVGAPPPSLSGVAFAVDGDEAALAMARHLIALLDGVAVAVPPEARVAWHLAAVFASNGVYALLEAAESVLREASLDPDAVLPSLARLAESSARAAATLGHVEGATGPVVRGDANTVAMHRAWIARRTPPLDPLYRELGDRLVSIAERAGSPVSATARVLAALHGDQPGAGDASGDEG
jgi:predicted short-subunit dehydrogenase-like oxidoreductase (DUF2520 family)